MLLRECLKKVNLRGLKRRRLGLGYFGFRRYLRFQRNLDFWIYLHTSLFTENLIRDFILKKVKTLEKKFSFFFNFILCILSFLRNFLLGFMLSFILCILSFLRNFLLGFMLSFLRNFLRHVTSFKNFISLRNDLTRVLTNFRKFLNLVVKNLFLYLSFSFNCFPDLNFNIDLLYVAGFNFVLISV